MTAEKTMHRLANLWIVRWGAKVEGIKSLKLCSKFKLMDISETDYSFSLPAEHLSDPHLRAGMLKSMASCGIDFATASAELVALDVWRGVMIGENEVFAPTTYWDRSTEEYLPH